ncbi:MAG: glycerol-3-phosphate 1-O-acyltransferase PlsY [Steroidobacteraceae bacterium]
MTEFALKVLLSYLLGSIVGSLLVGRLRGGVDIRRLGSGNAGGTNALRTQGKAFAFWVLLIDIGKGWIATRVLAPLAVPGPSPGGGAGSAGAHGPLMAAAQAHHWLAAACGIAVMLGHIYPLWHGFRGGKGVATLVGAVSGLDPWLLAPMVVTWLLAVVLFGFVGLASMLGAAALAVAAVIGTWQPRAALLSFGVLTAALIAVTHRSNIARMRAGTEPRARRLWLLGLRRGRV